MPNVVLILSTLITVATTRSGEAVTDFYAAEMTDGQWATWHMTKWPSGNFLKAPETVHLNKDLALWYQRQSAGAMGGRCLWLL